MCEESGVRGWECVIEESGVCGMCEVRRMCA